MLQLMFRCPYTNQPIQSGIELALENIKTMSDYPISLDCPHCKRRHHGTVSDGCLSQEHSPPLVPHKL
jgi:hypothetical protein